MSVYWMVNVVGRRCTHEGCNERASLVVHCSNVAVYGKQHAKEGMKNVVGRLCAHEGCRKKTSFGVESGMVAVYRRRTTW